VRSMSRHIRSFLFQKRRKQRRDKADKSVDGLSECVKVKREVKAHEKKSHRLDVD